MAAVDVGVAAGAVVAAGADVVGVVVALELWLELPQADTSRVRAATTKKPTGRNLAFFIRGRRDKRALVIRRTLIERY
jgi:hypothetical protein